MADEEMRPFVQVPDADGNVMIEALMGPYRGQVIKVPEAVGTAAITDKWAREPNLPPIDHDAEVAAMTPEELEAGLAASEAAAAHLRGEEGAPVYPVPPDPPDPPEGGARGRRKAEDDEDDDDDDDKPHRRQRK